MRSFESKIRDINDMAEFWEKNFQDKQEMWGWKPADSVADTVELFEEYGLTKS